MRWTSLTVLAAALGIGSALAEPLSGKTEGTPSVVGRVPGFGKSSTPEAAGPNPASASPAKPATAEPSPLPEMPTTVTILPAPARPVPIPVAPQKPAKPTPMPPITFFVAKGEPGVCGRGCAEWIAAEGTFDSDAPQRLRALLARLGKRKLPIYFHSPGGSVVAALAIGRMMRQRGMTAGVAWTVPQDCDLKQPREEACDKLKRSGRELTAAFETSRTMCNSACVYALVGASVREVAPGVGLGIHSSSITFFDRQSHARVKPPAHLVRAAMNSGYERIGAYLREMGIDPALLRAAQEIDHERVRFLTRAEIWRFNIDRRTFVESDWKVGERTVHKVFLSELKDSDYRTTLIRLSCWNSERLRIDFAREALPADSAGSAGVRISAGGSTQLLRRGRRINSSDNKVEYEVSTAYVPPAFFVQAGDEIEAVSDRDAGQPATAAAPTIKLSTVGLVPALAKLLPACGIAALEHARIEAPDSAKP